MYRFTTLLLLSSILFISLISAQSTPTNPSCVFWVSSLSKDDTNCTISNPCSNLKAAIILANDVTANCTTTDTRYIYMIPDGDYKGKGNVEFSVDIITSGIEEINIVVSSADLPADINNVVYPLANQSSKNVVINGEYNAFLIRFYPNKALYTFIGIDFINGNARGNVGYPLYVNEAPSVSFKSCTFQNNRGNKGGMLFISSVFSTSNITDCQFINNTGTLESGAVYIRQSFGINILNTTFQSNTASQGGALYVLNSNIVVNNCQFTNNNATNNGGAIYVSGSNVAANLGWRMNTFSKNTAVLGGAIYDTVSTIRYYNLNLTGNIASGKGGATYFLDSSSGIFKSVFANNSAAQGGAVFTVDSFPKGNQLLISESNFTMNMASVGGALYCNSSTARMNFQNTFEKNSAENADTAVEYCSITCLTTNKECGCTKGCGLPPPPVTVVTNSTETKIAIAIFVPVTAILLGLVGYLIWKTNKNKSKMQQRAFDEIRLTPNNDNEQL
ncbi:hypothetical protein PPL_09602 [Heterostelium album PN500]|uniref:Right handed beta helix domain-containing protein n=1 Tax=Heterostelium pallidum (strain ATCC 26659 / Pp 5 / PN500) TaxID=670386 RepID=D3BNT1_HETP5|nr:hypothetical protein PPL_09602 [Heterostelium album PN500]EFA76850.1 hypothetical protein PPL_09602 [Heterostelium album PN500]|eukprot:XP_020428982.1 hypothetical protein PPL_09602 [Heterostelium album PN500]